MEELKRMSAIYVDWANHCLEKLYTNKIITDLQKDVSDGVLLSELIEAVSQEKVRDIIEKPKSSTQMMFNINTCMSFLTAKGISCEGVNAKEIKDGNLKAILCLLFKISRYKQFRSQQQQENNSTNKNCTLSLNIRSEKTALSNAVGNHDQKKENKAVQNSGLKKDVQESREKTRSESIKRNRLPLYVEQAGNSSEKKSTLHEGSLNVQARTVAVNGSSTQLTRATSPALSCTSAIPTAIGRGRPGSVCDKPSNRTSVGSTSSNSSSKSSSSKPSVSSLSKNSMLEKFRFFAKDKEKKGACKGNSESISTVGSSNKSSNDSKSSQSVHSLPCNGVATIDVLSNKLHGSSSSQPSVSSRTSSSSKSPKKTLGLSFGGKKANKDVSIGSTVQRECNHKRVQDDGPASTNILSNSSGKTKELLNSQTVGKRERGALLHSSISISSAKNISKNNSFIPTNKTSVLSSSSSSGRSRQQIITTYSCRSEPLGRNLAPATPSIPPPALSSLHTGIPKPNLQKSNSSKDARCPLPANHCKDGSKNSNADSGIIEPSISHATHAASTKVAMQQQQVDHNQHSHNQQHSHSLQQVPLTQQQLQRHQLQLKQLQQQQLQHQFHKQVNCEAQRKHRPQHHESCSNSYSDQTQSMSFRTFSPIVALSAVPVHSGTENVVTSQASLGVSLNVSDCGCLRDQVDAHAANGSSRLKTPVDAGCIEGNENGQDGRNREQLKHAVTNPSLNDQVQARSYSHCVPSQGPHHYVPITISPQSIQDPIGSLHSGSSQIESMTIISENPCIDTCPDSIMSSPSVLRHGVASLAAVNVVKPNTHTKTKTDSNTQTNLSLLQQLHDRKKCDDTSSQATCLVQCGETFVAEKCVENKISTSKCHSQTIDKVQSKSQQSNPLLIEKERITENVHAISSSFGCITVQDSENGNFVPITSPTNDDGMTDTMKKVDSTRLAVNVLSSSINKTANNVAIVQPHHEDDMNPVIDRKISRNCVPQSNKGLAESSNEKTFLDDSGEAMYIKPMLPIMRSLPYGYVRGHTGVGNSTQNLNVHVPGNSTLPSCVYHARVQNHAVNVSGPALESIKLFNGQNFSSLSTDRPNSMNTDKDCSSDVDDFDQLSGYVSDGDVLKNSRHCNDDFFSGYLSEGGASLYARRLQQRFREGMQAVKECMQKSSGLVDDDILDDSTSISSDVSDTLADTNADVTLAGSSRNTLLEGKADGDAKRASRMKLRNEPSQQGEKDNSSIKSRNTMCMERGKNSSCGIDSRHCKHPLPQSALHMLSFHSSDCGIQYNSLGARKTRCDQPQYTNQRNLCTEDGIVGTLKISPNDGNCFISNEESNDKDVKKTYASLFGNHMNKHFEVSTNAVPEAHFGRNFASKCRSTNEELFTIATEHTPTVAISTILNATANSKFLWYGNPTCIGSPAVGSKLSRHCFDDISQAFESTNNAFPHTPTGHPRPASATTTTNFFKSETDESWQACSTLDSKGRFALSSSKSMGITVLHDNNHKTNYECNSLDRNILFDEKGNHMNSNIIAGACKGCPFNDTLDDQACFKRKSTMNNGMNHYVNLQALKSRRQLGQQDVSHLNNYVPVELPFITERHEGSCSAGRLPLGPTFWLRNSHAHVPPPAPPVSDDEIHVSNSKLVSTTSPQLQFLSPKERHAAEVKKLRRDIEAAHSKVYTLSSQLSDNAHVVSAFEQSLAHMTARLQALTSGTEGKAAPPFASFPETQDFIQDTELNDLKLTIEALRHHSGLVIADRTVFSPVSSRRHTSPAMVSKDVHSALMNEAGIIRQISSDSVGSVNSLSSACSVASHKSSNVDGEQKKITKGNKKGWLRSSFTKAFTGKKLKRSKTESLSDAEYDSRSLQFNTSAPNSPLMLTGNIPDSLGIFKGSHSSNVRWTETDVGVLKRQLQDRDAKLTDIRLEALSSAHQLEQLRDTMTRMKAEMNALKADNDRLHKLMSSSRSVSAPQEKNLTRVPDSCNDSLNRSFKFIDQTNLDMLLAETAANDRDGKQVMVTVCLGSDPHPLTPGVEKSGEVLIGTLSVSGKTKWDMLDNTIRRIFKEYVLRVDPITNLGLTTESIYSYHVGEITRSKESDVPELLPIGYLVGEVSQIEICLKGTKQQCVDSLAFETMIPKSIVQRHVSLMLDHRRIILSGPSGTGKSYLAQKLAEHVVLRSKEGLTAGCVAVIGVENKSANELRQYLGTVADQYESTSAALLPTVMILDNLHHASSAEILNDFLAAKSHKCQYIVGTMNQSTGSANNPQLHHSLKWVLCATHMEPVKGLLGRYLRRKLVAAEVRTGFKNNDLIRIMDWIPRVWTHINKILEMHNSADVTIGPHHFLLCPMDIASSQVWFNDLWNYTITPYITEIVQDGLRTYGRRVPWEDPKEWVLLTYPWSNIGADGHLLGISPHDVGYDVTQTMPLPSPLSQNDEVNVLKKLHEVTDVSDASADSDETG